MQAGITLGVVLLGLAVLAPSGTSQELRLCSTVDYGLGLDHVAIAVDDLSEAEETYRHLGFTLHPGRVHSDSVRGVRVELRTYADLELISPEDPASELGKEYLKFLDEREGGAFLALVYPGPLNDLVSAVEQAGEEPHVTSGPSAGYVSFPGSPDLSHVLIFERHVHSEASDSLMTHANHAVGIDKVWIQGTTRTEEFLLSLSPKSCGVDHHPAGFRGSTVGTALGHLVVVRPEGDPSRLRVLAVTLRSGVDALFAPEEAHGIWLRLVSPGRLP